MIIYFKVLRKTVIIAFIYIDLNVEKENRLD